MSEDQRTVPAIASTTPAVDDLAEAWRVSKALATSKLVPQEFRGKPENCFLALDIARRLDLGSITEVMHSMYVVRGNVGWKATFMIAMANARGPFEGPLRFRTTGEGGAMSVTCLAALRGGEAVEAAVSMAQAKKAGWTSNPKYQEIPEQMLRYRAATFFVRLYCPEVLLGMQTADELEDIEAAGPRAAEAEVSDAVTSMAAELAEDDDEEPEPAKPQVDEFGEPILFEEADE